LDRWCMEFRVLGRLEAWDAGRELSCTAPKQRTLLAVLLLHANEVVSLDRLIDELWGAAPPRTATVTLQNYVARLRNLLQAQGDHRVVGEVLVTRSPGYLLRVDDGEVDCYRFERLAAEGRQALAAGHAWRAGELLRAALSLWRGPAFADIALESLSRTQADRLNECRISAVEARVEADLRLGRHLELVAELEALVAEHPLRERLHHQLMLALYRSGRQADALAVYHHTRQVLVQELGLEPSPALQQLERAILQADPALEPVLPTVSVLPDEAGGRSGPCELPPDIDDFTGREGDLAEVARLLEGERVTAIVISEIVGKAGVGKTALAIHLAHRLRPCFPDGQLYVNLRGAEAQALDPAEVLAGFLRALGVQGAAIAEGLGERVRQYRSRLTDRQVLVVLDNAASEAQVRPLLPNSPGCAALVTSRARLSGLEAAHPMTLGCAEG
jgi:DNA-binding SARP family transcriptional activator